MNEAINLLLSLLDIKVQIDVLCHLSQHFSLPKVEYSQRVVFHLLLQGECQLKHGESYYHLQEGDLCLITQGDTHFLFSGEDAPIEEYYQNGILQKRSLLQAGEVSILCGHFITFNPATFNLMSLFSPLAIISLREIKQLRALATLIYQEALSEQPTAKSIIEHLSMALLLFALRYQSREAGTALLPLFSHSGMSRVAGAILKDPAINYRVEEWAAIANMSRANFARKFQKLTGLGVQQFIRTVRLSKAEKLLHNPSLSISQISDLVGYQSESAFIQAFKSQFQKTPALYRRQLQSSFK